MGAGSVSADLVLPRVAKPTGSSMSGRERLEPMTPVQGAVTLTSREVSVAADRTEVVLIPASDRLKPILVRIDELRMRPSGWDSYGGRPLQREAIPPLLQVLVWLDHVIQSEPAVSLTGEGGLELSWNCSDSLLELSVQPTAPPTLNVYFRENSGIEWEGRAQDCHLLDKWVWQASATV